MPFYTPGLNASSDGVAAAGRFIGFHIADPGAAGASEIAGTGRPATTWPTAANGSRVGSEVTAPIPANTQVTHWSIWTAQTGGVCLGAWPLNAPESFGAAGQIKHTPTLTSTN